MPIEIFQKLDIVDCGRAFRYQLNVGTMELGGNLALF